MFTGRIRARPAVVSGPMAGCCSVGLAGIPSNIAVALVSMLGNACCAFDLCLCSVCVRAITPWHVIVAGCGKAGLTSHPTAVRCLGLPGCRLWCIGIMSVHTWPGCKAPTLSAHVAGRIFVFGNACRWVFASVTDVPLVCPCSHVLLSRGVRTQRCVEPPFPAPRVPAQGCKTRQ